jgi:tetratricopeptide (TPR) repeat protein
VHQYNLREVEKLLHLTRSTIRALVEAGFVSPVRGKRGAWQFSFQDLVVLRKAQALVAAKVPARSIAKAMKELRRKAESGQYALALEDVPEAALLKVIQRKPEPLEVSINRGYALHEAGRLLEAEAEYGRALAAHGNDPLLLYNLGVLLEDLGRSKEALASYQTALDSDPAFADCHYNLALLYKGLGRPKEAIRHLAQYRKLSRGRPK